MKDYYQILEIAPDASQEAIKEQYRFLVQAWHPDKFPNSAQKLKAEEKLKEINAAYEILRNPAKRAEYDNLTRYAHSSRQREYHEQTAQRQSEDERRRAEEQIRLRKKQEEEEEMRHAQEVKRRQHQARKNHLCGSCGSSIDLDDIFCGNCGAVLIQKCKNCNGLVYQGDLHCGVCGALL